MKLQLLAALAACAVFSFALDPPKAGKPEILPLKEVKAGMQATAWTVFQGMTAEPVPIEIVGVWKNYLGPRQDVIVGKMGGKARETFVAAGLGGRPAYVDGKLIGEPSLRCGRCSADL